MKATLNHAWATASAALPSGWELDGVVRSSSANDDDLDSARVLDAVAVPQEAPWVALASSMMVRPPEGVYNVAGVADTPERALYALAEKLRGLR